MPTPIDFTQFRNKFFQTRYRWKWTHFSAERIAEISGVSLRTARRWEKRFKLIKGK